MKIRCFVALLCGFAAAGAAYADTVVVDDHVMVRESPVARPARGSTMTTVEAKFGAPATRWDYAGFSVFFERDRVIHAVVTSG